MEMLAQFYSCSGAKNHIRATMHMALCLERDLEFVGRQAERWEGGRVRGIEQRPKEGRLESDGTGDRWVWLKTYARVSVRVHVPKARVGGAR